jgi:hypothetical protein
LPYFDRDSCLSNALVSCFLRVYSPHLHCPFLSQYEVDLTIANFCLLPPPSLPQPILPALLISLLTSPNFLSDSGTLSSLPWPKNCSSCGSGGRRRPRILTRAQLPPTSRRPASARRSPACAAYRAARKESNAQTGRAGVRLPSRGCPRAAACAADFSWRTRCTTTLGSPST